jgi:predicted GIY-YIG superfamily endonuclease
MARKPRDLYLYELRDGHEIVYYGISHDPDNRLKQHLNSDKQFTHMNVNNVALTRPSVEARETDEIQRYEQQHGGRAPKYNIRKTRGNR